MFFSEYVQASNRVIRYLNCCVVRPGSIPAVDRPVFWDVPVTGRAAPYCLEVSSSYPGHDYAPLAQAVEGFSPFACAWIPEDQPMLCELLQASRPHQSQHTRQW